MELFLEHNKDKHRFVSIAVSAVDLPPAGKLNRILLGGFSAGWIHVTNALSNLRREPAESCIVLAKQETNAHSELRPGRTNITAVCTQR